MWINYKFMCLLLCYIYGFDAQVFIFININMVMNDHYIYIYLGRLYITNMNSLLPESGA
jgi:hypothetical protein